ncbi:MAG: hypothetical protein E7478_03520 [Ruminococcaceae bacterium]|nr:hypothetical protein [Oscillospiraceae bacterium]
MGEVAQLKEQLRRMQEEELKAVNDLRSLVIDMTSDISDRIEIMQGELSQVKARSDSAIAQISHLERGSESGRQSIAQADREIMESVCALEKRLDELSSALKSVGTNAEKGARSASEAVWANVFHDTCINSDWLDDKAFSPGRWAVGYQMLYVMYRILDEVRPKNILELGLGQSTKLCAQYAAHNSDVTHQVVEHDEDWIGFFRSNYSASMANTEIVMLDREMKPFINDSVVRCFAGFEERFSAQKFDLIIVDAPYSADMKKFARVDVLSIIPQCLCDDFVIIIDDAHRIGEKHTIEEIERVLKAAKIDHKIGRYHGDKECDVICSRSLSFLATL